MASLKELNRRLGRLKGTRKITNTMKLVAISKIKRMQARQAVMNAYRAELIRIARVTGVVPDGTVSLAGRASGKVSKIFLFVMTADRGMCGGFNHILCRSVSKWTKEMRKEGITVEMGLYGRKGRSLLCELSPSAVWYDGSSANPVYLDAAKIGAELQSRFTTGAFDEIWTAFNTVKPGGMVEPQISRLLPLNPDEIEEEFTQGDSADIDTDRLREPCIRDIREMIAGQYLHFKLYSLLVRSADGEQAARAVAMDNATRNVDELIDNCILVRNRTRQSAITRELIEITSGAEVLRTGGSG